MAIGRRLLDDVPKIAGMGWDDASRLLYDFLQDLSDTTAGLPTPHAETHAADGDDEIPELTAASSFVRHFLLMGA